MLSALAGSALMTPVSSASPVVHETRHVTPVRHGLGRMGVFSHVYVVVSVRPKNVWRSSWERSRQPSPATQKVHWVERPFRTRHVSFMPQSPAATVIVERRGYRCVTPVSASVFSKPLVA